MKNKGFTLVELLGVVIILSILVTLVFPSVVNFIKTSNSKKDKIINDLIIAAAESYIKDNSDEYSAIYGNTYCIPIDDLIELEYLDSDIVDKDTLNSKIIESTYNGNFEYNVIDNNSCNELAVKLEPNLIPVIYNGTNWLVVDASKEKWFDYDKQNWANVVILDSNVTKKIGDIVIVDGENPEAIAMFVWIPRYSYTIGNTYGVQLSGGNTPSALTPGAIDIKFVSKDVKELGTASYTEDTPINYRTHPAFTFGTEEVSGIWVGKFETSHMTLSNNTMTNSLGCGNESCISADGIRILPNAPILAFNNVSNFFYAARSMSRSGNSFAIDPNKLDSHMLKNIEWGAVAYLSQSKYGKYGNNNYEGVNKEIFMNNSGIYSNYQLFFSGVSAGSPSAEGVKGGTYKYDEEKVGTGASTTGNITGIYDMNGGGYEYVMGYYSSASDSLGIWGSTLTVNNAGFKEKPLLKYFDEYSSNDSYKACNSEICYGHAFTETPTWYDDFQLFVNESYPWVIRGGYYEYYERAGIFHQQRTTGNGNTPSYTMRVAMTPITNN